MARLKDYVIFFKCRNAGDIVEPMEFKLSALNADDARRKGYKILDIDKFTILKAKPLLKIEREMNPSLYVYYKPSFSKANINSLTISLLRMSSGVNLTTPTPSMLCFSTRLQNRSSPSSRISRCLLSPVIMRIEP